MSESERLPVDPLREAAQAVVNGAEPDDNFDGEFIDYLVPFDAIDALRAALASPAAPRPEGLDVERLARVLHSQPHHYRGGADDDLARSACTQLSGPSKCERKAASIAREYERLSDTADTES